MADDNVLSPFEIIVIEITMQRRIVSPKTEMSPSNDALFLPARE